MVEYTCPKCNKVFTRKSTFINHTEKKIYSCIQNTPEPLKNKVDLLKNIVKPLKNPLKLRPNDKIKYKSVDKNDDVEHDNNNIKNNVCEYCLKGFNRSDNFNTHVLKHCKVKKSIDNENESNLNLLIKKDELIVELVKKNQELTELVLKNTPNNTLTDSNNINNKSVNNGTVNTNTNTNNGTVNNVNNIRIEFGKEDLSKITDDFFIKTLINSSGAAIPCKIIEGMHFNPELRENMNVYIADSSRNKAMTYDGKQWNIANADETVDTLFEKAVFFCENRNEELCEKIEKNEKIKKKINKEMYVMNIMNNHEAYEYDEHKQPLDSEGNILDPDELKRGLSLNGKAKEYITKYLSNNKHIITKSLSNNKNAIKKIT
jgi:hypothetical protein